MFLSSCYDFESEPLNINSEERVLNPGDSTENSSVKQLFYACYLYLPYLHDRFASSSYLDAATDDALPTLSTSNDLDDWRNGLISAGNIPDAGAWSNGYWGIRKVNLFLSKVDIFPPSSQVPANKIKEMKAEARLLRAYYYFEMLKRWGGVPLLGDRILTADDDLNIPRNTIAEIADYITTEISPEVETSCYRDLHAAQSIANDNDPEGKNPGNMIGHVNQGVALALLSRLHLYLASDLYAESASDRTALWQTAAKWAKQLIDLNVYELYQRPNNLVDFQFAMDSKDFPNKEMIMLNIAGSANTNIEILNSPIGYSYQSSGGGLVTTDGRTSPSQNLVDAFLTADGKSIYKNYDPEQGYDPQSGYNEQDPYSNRDPRLNSFIFCNGSRWLNKRVETFDGGAHRNTSQGATTRTGYYLKKFLGSNENTNLFTAYYHHYQIFRYAEILLNYAEALNESDPSKKAEIESGLIALRKRAGIAPGSDNRYGLPATYTQELMRQIIRNERRIELCFEEHRFWDVRRWKIAEDVLNKPLRGVRITRQSDGSYTYVYGNVATASFKAPMMYWYPIQRYEMWGNKALEQNPGWSY